MLSLDNTYSLQELKQWFGRVVKGLDGLEPSMVAELKIDGLSCSLTYRNGQLALAATRGDGVTGEDVTHNAKTIRDIPLSLKGKVPALLEIRGEVYMDKVDFAALNQQRKDNGRRLPHIAKEIQHLHVRHQSIGREHETLQRVGGHGADNKDEEAEQ